MLTDKQIVQKARELITPEGAWIQGNYARDENGIGVDPWNTQAVCWCTLGAIQKIAYDNGSDVANGGAFTRIHIGSLIYRTGCTKDIEVPLFNDTKTHEQVLAALDCAIEKMAD